MHCGLVFASCSSAGVELCGVVGTARRAVEGASLALCRGFRGAVLLQQVLGGRSASPRYWERDATQTTGGREGMDAPMRKGGELVHGPHVGSRRLVVRAPSCAARDLTGEKAFAMRVAWDLGRSSTGSCVTLLCGLHVSTLRERKCDARLMEGKAVREEFETLNAHCYSWLLGPWRVGGW